MAPRWRKDDDDDEFDPAFDNDDDQFDDDDEFDDDLAENDREGNDEIPCPNCGKPVYEDAPRCPHCGQYTSDVDAPARMKPLWIVIGTLACLYAITRWVFG